MASFLFTEKTLTALTQADREVEYHDTKITGLTVRVSPRGKKTFSFLYRLPSALGRPVSKRVKVGHYPDITLDDARRVAKEKRRMVELGQDPTERPTHVVLFEDLTAEFVERHSKPNKKSWRMDVQRIDTELLPHWRGQPVASITRKRIRDLLLAIVDRPAPATAQAIKVLLTRMFRYGISQGLVQMEGNPAGMIELPHRHKRQPRRLTADEIGRLWAVWDDFTKAGRPLIGEQFKLRVLTAQRGGEILTMRWSDVDLDAALWTKPFEFRKLPPTCDHRLPHLVPLPPMAVTILRALQAWKDGELERMNRMYNGTRGWPRKPSDWVFSSFWEKGLHKPLPNRQADAAGEMSKWANVPDFHPHDLRHWGSTTANATCRPEWAERLLDHKIAGVAGIYNQYEYMEHKTYVVYTLENAVRAILKMPAIPMPPRPAN